MSAAEGRYVYIIGGGPMGLNVIRWARLAGLKVIVTDRDKNAPGLRMGDVTGIIDATDSTKHIEFAKEIMNRCHLTGVYCGVEPGVMTVGALSEFLGLEFNSEESIKYTLDKIRMKTRLAEAGIPSPEFTIVHDDTELQEIIDLKKCKYVIKPSKGSGSRGVRVVGPWSDASDLFRQCHDSMVDVGEIIAETFIEGRSIDANGVFLKEDFYPAGILEKYQTPLPDCLPIGGYDPVDLPEVEKEELYHLLEKSCRSLGLTTGPVKGDFIRSESGYMLLEVAPRFHGDVTTSNTLPYGSGINPVLFYFKYLMDQKVDTSLISPRETGYATWRVICLPPGTEPREVFKGPVKRNGNIKMFWLNEKYSSKKDRYISTVQIPGYICAAGRDRMECEKALEKFFRENASLSSHFESNEWYVQLGKSIDAAGFSRKSCCYQS